MRNKQYAFGLCFMAIVTIALLAASIGTIEWAILKVVPNDNNNVTYCDVTRKMGLFRFEDVVTSTTSCLNSGHLLSASVYDENYLIFNHGLLQAVIAFCALGIICNLITMGVASFNICSNPYEHYLTPIAMLIYNAVGLVLSLVAVILYTVLLYGDLQDPLVAEYPGSPATGNIYQSVYGVENSYFGFSFFLVVVAIITQLIGILLAAMSERSVVVNCFKKKEEPNNNKGQDVMMF
uniref:uncharacterized protein LOC120345479 n=1 Tax=Styela clava TaxID=7725 RepID=UPI00193A81B8|nr:uncharacterized protein LOC120345479 [Styela clava]